MRFNLALLSALFVAGCSMLPFEEDATRAAQATPGQPEDSAQPPKRHTVALPDFDRAARQQQHPEWCWAACAEMAFRYRGIDDITQDTLAKQFKTDKVNQTANRQEIIRALAYAHNRQKRAEARSWTEYSGIQLDLAGPAEALFKAILTNIVRDETVDDLRHGNIILLGLQNYQTFPGHVVVVTAIEYEDKEPIEVPQGIIGDVFGDFFRKGKEVQAAVDANMLYDVRRIEIYDPFPYPPDQDPSPAKDGRRILDIDTLKRHKPFWLSERQAVEIVEKASVVKFNNG